MRIPDGATLLDDSLRPDIVPIAFGLNHTDSNQHINSLVYPRLFEGAALRRLSTHGVPSKLLARHVEIAYRKPFFVGQIARIHLQAFDSDEGLGVVGCFTEEKDSTTAKAHCYIRMHFSK